MKTIAYLDCPSGISGDMCLGAILDAGVPLEYLQTQLNRLGLGDEFQLSATPVLRQGLRALKAKVDLKASQPQDTVDDSEPHGHPHHPHDVHRHRATAHRTTTHNTTAHRATTHNTTTHNTVSSSAHSTTHTHTSHHGDGQSHHHHSHSHSHTSSSPGTDHAHPVHPHAGDHAPHPEGTRHLPEIEALITQAGLPDRACGWSLAVFRQLAAAEAAVHGIPVDQVHFHEVGATDALVDIVGTCLGLDYLGIDTLFCSALPTGQGRVKAAHGWLPVPAPAVLKLMEMRQIPIYSNGLWGEQVTPTGAALVAALAEGFGQPPTMTLQRVGLGAGQKDFPQANILRLWVGAVDVSPNPPSSPPSWTPAPQSPPIQDGPDNAGSPEVFPSPAPSARSDRSRNTAVGSDPSENDPPGSDLSENEQARNHQPKQPTQPNTETIAVLETQVDDMVPQAMGYLYDRLFEAGALDVFAQPVVMKKSRPGLLMTVLCPPEAEARCTEVLFAETPTLGIRHRRQQRTLLNRGFETLDTPYGPVSMKLAYHPQTQAVLKVHPEYEDCAALARQHGVPWQVVYHTALGIWYRPES